MHPNRRPYTIERVIDEDLRILVRVVVTDDVTDDTAVFEMPCHEFSEHCLQTLRTSLELEAWQSVADTLVPEVGEAAVRDAIERVAQQTVERLRTSR